MRARAILPVLLALVVLPIAASPTLAQYGRPQRVTRYSRGFELSPYLTFNEFQEKAQLDDELGLGFRFGYLYTPYHEIEFMLNGVGTNDNAGFGERVNLSNFQVAYVFNFTKKDVVPYLTVGVGFLHSDDADLGTETDFVRAFGGGLRLFMGRNAVARFELRENYFQGQGPVWFDGEGQWVREWLFGVGWRYGLP